MVHSTDKTIDFLWLIKSGCFRDQVHRTTYVMFLDSSFWMSWEIFWYLTHTLVSLPVNLCHFLCLSLGNGESRYC